MYSFHVVPEYIKNEIESRGVKLNDIIMAIPCDISIDGFFCEHWVLAGKDEIITVSGNSANKNSVLASDAQYWKCTAFNKFKLNKIEKTMIHDLVSGGYLVALIDGRQNIIARFTANRRREFAVFSKNIGRLKENKEIYSSDFENEKYSNYCPRCKTMFPNQNHKVCPKCLDKRSIFLRVLSFAMNYKVGYAIVILLMISSAFLDIIRPYLEGNILFDGVLSENGRYKGFLGPVVLLIALSQALKVLVNIFITRINTGLTANIVYDIKTKVFTSLESLSMGYFTNKQTGGLITRINDDSNNLQNIFLEFLPFIFINLIILIGSLVSMFSLNYKLALIVIIPIPIAAFFSRKVFPVLNRLFSKHFKTRKYLNEILNDALTGFRVIKAFGRENTEIERFGRANDSMNTAAINIRQYETTIFPILNSFVNTGALFVWAYGGWQTATGVITFGTLITFVRYVGMMYEPLRFISNLIDQGSNSINSAQRIFEIIDADPEIYDSPECRKIENLKGDIEFRNVLFSYEPNKPVIKNISLKIKPGEMVGIVGHSGAGKSTLANLMLRLYDIDEGCILIDGINIREIPLACLHKNIGMVMQDTFLFSGSVAENISFGRPEASVAEIVAAAKMANAHDFIMKLPEGYDTIIGNAGRELSGGERQRLSIARTILHDPSILILDEATASVDTKTEQKIQKSLETLIKGKTSIVIAHRLSTLSIADRIIVVNNGEIIEQGTHDELIGKDGEYRRMYDKQKEALKLKEVV